MGLEHTPASLRARLDLTQVQAAKAAKVSRTTLIAIDEGDTSVSLELVERVAKAYRVTTEDLIAAMRHAAATLSGGSARGAGARK